MGIFGGGLISSQEVIADFDGDGIDEYLLIRATSSHFTYTGEYMSYFKQKAFLYRRGKLISENPFTNELLDSSKLIKVENKGFSPGVVFLKASVSAADAGEFAATSHYYYLSQNKFHLICELHSGGGYGSETRMYPVFPTSQGGKKNTIIIKETNTYIPDYHKGGTASKEETQIIAEYTWNGTVFRKTR